MQTARAPLGRRAPLAAALAALLVLSWHAAAAGAGGDGPGRGGEGASEERVRALAGELADLRGRPLGDDIEGRLVRADGLGEGARELASAGPARGADGAAFLARFGFAPEGGPAPHRVFEGARGGFYDLRAGRLYAGRDAAGPGLAWSVARAVRDADVGAASFLAAAESADARAARRAVFEGDAAVLALERELGREGLGVPWGSRAAVDLLRRLGDDGGGAGGAWEADALFPYREGAAFVARLRRSQPWSAIDALYERPPLSTSHILHPERYERYDRPLAIRRGRVGPAELYELAYDDVRGELGLKVWLMQRGLERARAARAAAGWAGDRLAIYRPPAEAGGMWPELAVSYSAWASEIDAAEFFEAASRALDAGETRRVASAGDEHFAFASGALERSWVERRGAEVVVGLGALSAWEDAIRRAVWESWGEAEDDPGPRRRDGGEGRDRHAREAP